MSLCVPDRVVVFDYGEVISQPPNERDRAQLVSLAGVPHELFWEPYWAHRDGLDQGTTSVRDYWMLVAADLDAHWSESRIQELWVADFSSWLSIDPETFDIISDLARGGTRLALLSNAGFDFSSPFRFSPLARFFERIFLSAELGLIKPDPQIFVEVAAELGITPTEMVFIDNKHENIVGAESLGILGHHFVTAPALRTFLESIALPAVDE